MPCKRIKLSNGFYFLILDQVSKFKWKGIYQVSKFKWEGTIPSFLHRCTIRCRGTICKSFREFSFQYHITMPQDLIISLFFPTELCSTSLLRSFCRQEFLWLLPNKTYEKNCTKTYQKYWTNLWPTQDQYWILFNRFVLVVYESFSDLL